MALPARQLPTYHRDRAPRGPLPKEDATRLSIEADVHPEGQPLLYHLESELGCSEVQELIECSSALGRPRPVTLLTQEEFQGPHYLPVVGAKLACPVQLAKDLLQLPLRPRDAHTQQLLQRLLTDLVLVLKQLVA